MHSRHDSLVAEQASLAFVRLVAFCDYCSNVVEPCPQFGYIDALMAFERKKPAAIGLKANFPGFISPRESTRCRAVIAGSTRSSSTAIGRRKGTDLIYAGKVDHGFDKASTAGAIDAALAGQSSARLRLLRRAKTNKRGAYILFEPISSACWSARKARRLDARPSLRRAAFCGPAA